jgi:hypothetical protein
MVVGLGGSPEAFFRPSHVASLSDPNLDTSGKKIPRERSSFVLLPTCSPTAPCHLLVAITRIENTNGFSRRNTDTSAARIRNNRLSSTFKRYFAARHDGCCWHAGEMSTSACIWTTVFLSRNHSEMTCAMSSVAFLPRDRTTCRCSIYTTPV